MPLMWFSRTRMAALKNCFPDHLLFHLKVSSTIQIYGGFKQWGCGKWSSSAGLHKSGKKWGDISLSLKWRTSATNAHILDFYVTETTSSGPDIFSLRMFFLFFFILVLQAEMSTRLVADFNGSFRKWWMHYRLQIWISNWCLIKTNGSPAADKHKALTRRVWYSESLRMQVSAKCGCIIDPRKREMFSWTKTSL